MIFARLRGYVLADRAELQRRRGQPAPERQPGILAYMTVPVAVLALWAAYYLTQLNARPLVNVNDPHLEEMLEPEHAH